LYLAFPFSLFTSQYLYAQTQLSRQQEYFIRHLLEQNDSLKYDVDPVDEQLSQRLGIRYEGVKHKFLISYELSSSLRTAIQQQRCRVECDSLGGIFSRITFSLPEESLAQQYYFRSGKLIAPMTYFTHHWKKIVTKYFIFLISDSTAFNDYSIQRLEDFTETMLDSLDFSSADREVLANKKIYYVLCRDENEIEQVTGFKTRGMYNLAYDMVVTTYNCHYHELLHLLMNYKIKSLPLYTLPLLQEGFAVAFGGRGGYEPDVLLHTGAFLQYSGFADVRDLFSRQSFARTDASISYPVSGLFVANLFHSVGAKTFCALYRKYSGTDSQVDTMTFCDITTEQSWEESVRGYALTPMISIGTDAKSFPLQTEGKEHDSDHWYVCFKDTLLIQSTKSSAIRFSKKFKELFPARIYHGEHYAMIASPTELSLYDLYTGNLIANYIQSFSSTLRPIVNSDGFIRCILPQKTLQDVTERQ